LLFSQHTPSIGMQDANDHDPQQNESRDSRRSSADKHGGQEIHFDILRRVPRH
jgi:hypothetical protein